MIFVGTYAKIYEDRLRVNNVAGITTVCQVPSGMFIGRGIAGKDAPLDAVLVPGR